jgi:hypothetical protein
MEDPPTISLYVVARLAHPNFLVEIDAVAVRRATVAAGRAPPSTHTPVPPER